VNWIHLALDRGKRYAFTNVVMNFQVSYEAGKVVSCVRNCPPIEDFIL